MSKKALIIQGGGFRTGFSAGVLDVFLEKKHVDFDIYAGSSGGAIALSYFLGNQPRSCFVAMCFMAQDPQFMSYYRMTSDVGIMDVDYLEEVANEVIPFDLDHALSFIRNKEIGIVLTDIENGKAAYHKPNREDWLQAVIASCTLPFVTKGKHELNGRMYMDGGWADPLPVQWAVEKGASDLLVIRTLPPTLKLAQTWTDYFGSIYHSSSDGLKRIFAESHTIYNNSIDYMENPPDGIYIHQIAPEVPLTAGTYSNNVNSITKDYFLGREMALAYLNELS
ncbi:MAG: patatin family protein [Bacteroidota bacterium]